MTQPPAARVGDPAELIDTPALVVDLDLLEANIRHMAEYAAARGLRLRPHAKTHKCAEIARLQIAAGAVGICCQKIGEAEALAHAGVSDILVSNQVVTDAKLSRLAALSRSIRIAVCADDAANVDRIAAAAQRFGTEITVLVEIDVGTGRCGVAPGVQALDLARQIARTRGLRFGGLQAYHGRAQHIRDHGERRAAIAAAAGGLRQTLDLLTAEGLTCETVGGAGTGSFPFEAEFGLWNELQVGSYVFMDADYARNLDADGGPDRTFGHALTVRSTVISTAVEGRIVTDAGLKAFSMESGGPAVRDAPWAEVLGVSDEHTVIAVAQGANRPGIGTALDLIPGHCDPTVNLHDWIIGLRNGIVESVWPVTARGALS